LIQFLQVGCSALYLQNSSAIFLPSIHQNWNLLLANQVGDHCTPIDSAIFTSSANNFQPSQLVTHASIFLESHLIALIAASGHSVTLP